MSLIRFNTYADNRDRTGDLWIALELWNDVVQKGAVSWCSQRAVRGDPHSVWTCVVYSVETLHIRQFFML